MIRIMKIEMIGGAPSVIPAKAGIQTTDHHQVVDLHFVSKLLGSRPPHLCVEAPVRRRRDDKKRKYIFWRLHK